MDKSSLTNAFLITMRKQAEGVLARYLFGEPWDQYVLDRGPYNAGREDEKDAIAFALKQGLANHLPRVIQFLEYGAGGNTGVIKPMQLIDALLAEGFTVSSYVAIDAEGRYAQESSLAIAEKFKSHDRPQIHTRAIVGDFMSGSKIDIPPPLPGAVPLIGIFGRTLSNVPDYSMSGGKNSQQNCADSITLMKNRHRNGTTENLYLLTTYHEETDRNRLLEEYSVTSELKQFILGIFPLVLKHGIITDRNYHFEDYWIVAQDYDDKNHVIKLCAKCLKEHTMRTVDGDIHIGEGEQFAPILSHKWGGCVYYDICRSQDASEITFYRDPQKHTGVMLAKFSVGLVGERQNVGGQAARA